MLFAIKCFFLWPFALLFAFISELRNFLFNYNIFKSKKLPVPVVSIGNLSAGGTGKTPFVISLLKELENHFNHIAVISRGYGRKSRGALIVSERGNLQVNVLDSGDEPYLIAKKAVKSTVIVAEKRLDGWQLIKSKDVDLIILDDAFQHRWLSRDLDILLENGNYPIDKDHIIPLGRLRELKRNIHRADIICTTKTKYKTMPKGRFFSKINATNADDLSKNEFILISGIANPNEFEDICKKNGIIFKKHLVYKDHKDYESLDLSEYNDHMMLTTEKDYPKLVSKLSKLFVLSVSYDIDAKIIKRICDLHHY